MAGGVGSLTYQCTQAFATLQRFGEGKRATRLRLRGHSHVPLNRVPLPGIHGRATYRTYLRIAVRFVTLARRHHGLRRLVDLNMPCLGTAYLIMLRHAGCSAWTLRTVLCALDRLSDAVGAKWGRDVGRVDRAALGPLPPRRLSERRFASAYGPEEAARILLWIGARRPDVARALRTQYAAGLRVCEVCGLRARMLDAKRQALVITATTTTKGGRDRYVPLPLDAALFSAIRSSVGEDPEARVFLLQPDTLRAWVRRACDALGLPRRGTHGFRHAFAREALSRLLAQGLRRAEALRIVAELLGHGRASATRPYLVE